MNDTAVVHFTPYVTMMDMPHDQVAAWLRWGEQHGVPIKDQLLGVPVVIDYERHRITLSVLRFGDGTWEPRREVYQLESGPLPPPDHD